MSVPKVISLDEFDCSMISILNFEPEKRSCLISYDDELNFVIKTGKMKIYKSTPLYLDLIPENSGDIEKFNMYDEQVICSISENSSEWFNKSLSVDGVDDMYKRSVKLKKQSEVVIRVYLDEITDVYDSSKELVETSQETLKSGTSIRCILKCGNVLFENTKSSVKWTLCQCMLSKEKMKKDRCLLEDDEEI